MSDYEQNESAGSQQNVRTFTATSLREALAEIRRELGPDALILGQEQVGHRFAVRACLELPPEPPKVASVDTELPAADQRAPVTPASLRIPEPPLREATAPAEIETPINGLSAALIDELGGGGPDDFRRALAQRLNYAHKTIADLRGCYRFVGMSGVGKSSTLIKVLVEWVLSNNPRNVIVLSTDKDRLAGTEALQLTCQMLGVAMRECMPEELPAQLKQLSSKALVLIDSAALSLRKPATSVAGVQDIWVCSALHGAAQLEAQYEQVRGTRPAGIVVSQLDQSSDNDEISGLLYRWRIPLYWLGTSAQLPDGIEQANESSALQYLFDGQPTAALDIAV